MILSPYSAHSAYRAHGWAGKLAVWGREKELEDEEGRRKKGKVVVKMANFV